MNIPQIAVHVHRLVVGDQRMNEAAGLFGLLFEPHEKVHGFTGIRTAMGYIARLHQVGLPACPLVFSVNDPRRAQHLDKLSVVAVHVADGHDPLHSAPSIFRCCVRGRAGSSMSATPATMSRNLRQRGSDFMSIF